MTSTDPNERDFDCVQMMRGIRDRIDREIAGMSHEEYAEWLDSHEYEDPVLAYHAEKCKEKRAELRAAESRRAGAKAD